MTTATLVFVLLGLLTVLNSIAVIALVRQVGLLHLRLRPLGALSTPTGPRRGAALAFGREHWDFGALGPDVERGVFAFISPTCSICTPLLPGVRSLSAAASKHEAWCLVSDTSAPRFAEYLGGKRLGHLPAIADADAFKRNDIPGAPFVVVTDRLGVVLSAGGVNSHEQIESLIDQARKVLPGSAPADGTARNGGGTAATIAIEGASNVA